MGKVLKKLFLILFISLFFVSYSQAFNSKHFHIPKVKVMDQNMYLGADLSPLFGEELNPEEIEIVAGEIIAEIIASNYPARAEAFAKMIKTLRPDVVCFQEAWIFEFKPLGINWDFKELILDALGDEYKEVVTNEELLDLNLQTFGVRIKDQDVIIAKKYVAIVGEPETTIFDAQLTLPTAIGTVKVTRGLSTARLRIRGAEYLIGNTHLEAFHPTVRLSRRRSTPE